MKYKRVVIKIGTAILTKNGKLSKKRILNIADLVMRLKKIGIDIILVSSGAVSAGHIKLQLDKTKLVNRQALASIGQTYLMSIYQKEFYKFDITISQVLLTRTDFDSRKRSSNIKQTINVLLKNGILPIINENDSVATDELVFGDNDQLSAYSTHFLDADVLVILSDIDGYFDKNPHIYADAKIRKLVQEINDYELLQEVSPNNEFATGGIVTKLKSAKFLMDRSQSMFLSSGINLKFVEKFITGQSYKKGTLFKSKI